MINHDHASHSRRYTLLMVLGCLILVVALTAIYLFRVPAPTVLVYAIFLLCPLSHILMMALMGRDHKQPTSANNLANGTDGGDKSGARGAACH